MTQEEKQLLLKDLCARAQYKVNIHVLKGIRIHDNGKVKKSDLIDTVYGVIFYNDEPKIVTPQNFSFLDRNGIRNFGGWTVEEVRPYLRPMSSMTPKEIKTYRTLQDTACSYHYEFGDIVDDFLHFDNDTSLDYLNSIHIDYRGLIGRGLALEAPEDMYKTE